MRASTNPIQFCEGGFYGGHLKPSDKVKPLLKPMTASFGITALNELQELWNGKSLVEDGQFALEVMQHINDKVNQFKEDGWLYAIYGTPAESLCGRRLRRIKMFVVIENVSGRNCKQQFPLSCDRNITRFRNKTWKEVLELVQWWKIQYVRYPANVDASEHLSEGQCSLDL